jgi:hypothetical protein
MFSKHPVKTFLLLSLCCFAVGMFCARLFLFPPRNVDSSRIEQCLHLLIEHKKNSDPEQLQQRLTQMKMTPAQFEKIIDRCLHYRTCQSSINQAMRLLEAFRAGYTIAPKEVFSKSDAENYSFALDAEILTVFKEKPELVQLAFGS